MSQNGHRNDVRIGAPPAAASGHPYRKDVTLHAPAAQVYAPYLAARPNGADVTPGNVIHWQNEEIRQLRVQAKEAQITASTIANLAISYAHMLAERGESINVPKELWLRMQGATVTVRPDELDETLIVEIRERGEFPVEREA